MRRAGRERAHETVGQLRLAAPAPEHLHRLLLLGLPRPELHDRREPPPAEAGPPGDSGLVGSRSPIGSLGRPAGSCRLARESLAIAALRSQRAPAPGHGPGGGGGTAPPVYAAQPAGFGGGNEDAGLIPVAPSVADWWPGGGCLNTLVGASGMSTSGASPVDGASFCAGAGDAGVSNPAGGGLPPGTGACFFPAGRCDTAGPEACSGSKNEEPGVNGVDDAGPVDVGSPPASSGTSTFFSGGAGWK
jgi:hypothetical protein